jgi:hypothetical protein
MAEQEQEQDKNKRIRLRERARGQKISNLEMDIFCLFKFCHNRRNGF